MATRKCGNIYFRKYVMAFRKITNIVVLLLILMIGSRILYIIPRFLHIKKCRHCGPHPSSIKYSILISHNRLLNALSRPTAKIPTTQSAVGLSWGNPRPGALFRVNFRSAMGKSSFNVVALKF